MNSRPTSFVYVEVYVIEYIHDEYNKIMFSSFGIAWIKMQIFLSRSLFSSYQFISVVKLPGPIFQKYIWINRNSLSENSVFFLFSFLESILAFIPFLSFLQTALSTLSESLSNSDFLVQIILFSFHLASIFQSRICWT